MCSLEVFMNPLTNYLYNYFDEVTPYEFYREMFPAGELQAQGVTNDGKCNGIVVQITNEIVKYTDEKGREKEKPLVKRYMLHDGLENLDKLTESEHFALCSPLSYVGKKRTAENARYAYGIAVDLDHIIVEGEDPRGLRALWKQIEIAERIPKPTYIVSSGTGLHLYYFFDKAIPLYKNTINQLQRYKKELTRIVWHEGAIVDIDGDKDVQYEGIYQGFRVPGTITKKGTRARAFLTGEKVGFDYLNEFVEPKYQVTEFTYKSDLTLAEAKAKYPEWHQKVIVEGDRTPTPWTLSRNVYDWWKREIKKGARVNHRYYCLWTLAMFGQKCSYYDEKKNPNPVTYEELENDCFEFMEHMESLTNNENNHFTKEDVFDALEGFQEGFISYPKNSISYKAGIDIVPSIPRRKKGQRLKQTDHLEEARMIRDLRMKRQGKDWREGNGRPKGAKAKNSKYQRQVQEWRKANPEGKKADCHRDTGLDPKTIRKWWNE